MSIEVGSLWRLREIDPESFDFLDAEDTPEYLLVLDFGVAEKYLLCCTDAGEEIELPIAHIQDWYRQIHPRLPRNKQ